MRKRTLTTLFSGIVLGGIAVSTAPAAVSFSYSTDALSYNVGVGNTVAVQIYLKETLTGASTDLIAGDSGLSTAGAGVQETSLGAGGTLSTIANASGTFTAASAFSGLFGAFYDQASGDNLEFSESTPVSNPPTGVPPVELSSTVYRVLLGTLDIKQSTGITTFALTSLSAEDFGTLGGPGDGNTLAANGTDFDKTGQSAFTGADAATYSFTVGAPVPEPASFTLLGLGAFGLLARNRRKTA